MDVQRSGQAPGPTTRSRSRPQPSGSLPTTRVSLAAFRPRSSLCFEPGWPTRTARIRVMPNRCVTELAAARTRVEGILQAVAENIEGEDRQRQGESGEG